MIIAITGRVGSGKSTLLDMLWTAGYVVQRASFASALKTEVANGLGVDPAYIAENKNAVRPVLVTWADFRRWQEDRYWIKRLIPMLTRLTTAGITPIVDDMRYTNEADWLGGGWGACLVHLNCPREDSIAYMIEKGLLAEEADIVSHSPGETQLLDYARFDIRIEAPRRRPLDSILGELIMRLTVLDAMPPKGDPRG